jgi:two-component system nitrate/nitrite sensor histidine kinase NarX
MLDVTWGAVWLHDDDTDTWFVAVSLGFTQAGTKGARFSAGTALPCLAGERGEPLLIEDLDQVEFHRLSDEHDKLRSAMYAPMWLGQRTVGVLSVYSDRQGAYTADDLQLLTAIGEHLGVAVAFSVMDERARRIAVLEERDRQARDLHDGVSQVLCSLRAWVLETEEALESGEGARVGELLSSIRCTIDEADAEVRDSIRLLRHAPVGRDFFVDLEWACQHLDAVGIETVVDVETEHIPEVTSDTLAWILREATNNVMKHSEATKARIVLSLSRDHVVLVVEDDGSGLVSKEQDGSSSTGLHIGLSVMEERAAKIGGSVSLSSIPGEGTRIECRLPALSS